MELTFQKYLLSNGITLIVQENHHAQSVVFRGHWLGGANQEPPELSGLASFTGSMIRRGNARRTFAEINETVESVAANVYVNSGRHLTTFGGKSLAEDYDLLAEVLFDTLLTPTFPDREIEKVRGQTLTSLKESEDSTRSMAGLYFRRALYTPDHPYGRPVGGTRATVAAIRREDLVRFYETTLFPRQGTVVVVGDVTGPAVYQSLEARLGQWQPSHSPPDFSLPPPPPLSETGRYVHPMANKSQADLILGNVGPSRQAGDYYAAEVANAILGELGLGGRIGRRVRDNAGMAYYARSSLGSNLGPAPWLIYAGVNPAAVDQALALILAELHHFCQEPVGDQELADAKAYLSGVLPLQLETNEGVAAMLLEMHLYQLGENFVARYPQIIDSVTKDEVLAAARNYLHPDRYALSIAGPYPAAAA